ncbi:MAG: helix-turn-helix domain-containing protein, partial [Dermatophilaceae bacterium]
MPVDRRGARHGNTLERQGARKEPLSAARIVRAALDLVAAEGFEALTMRRVAAALDTGPASLYAHVVNKADLDELLIGYLCSQIDLPEPDPDTWRE